QRRGLARGGRVRGEHDLPHGNVRGGDAGEQLHHLQVLRIDAVDRREGPAEHVVDAVVLVRALHRDHVAGLLHDADQPVVAPRVLADAAARLVGEGEADLAQPDLLLDLPDRLGQRRGVLARGAQDVEGQPLRRAIADPRKLRELCNKPLDRRRVGGAHRPGRPSPPRLPRSRPPVAPPSFAAASSWALRSASLTAASTMSARISTSSGSTAEGSIRTSLTTRSPLTFTVTMPPPAEASTTSFFSSSCAISMSCCIF